MGFVVAGGGGADPGVVGVAAAGQADVERFSGAAGGDDEVGFVDGEALGAVDGDGVAEFDVFGDVVGGQSHRYRRRLVGVAPGCGEGAVGVDGGDGERVAVADPRRSWSVRLRSLRRARMRSPTPAVQPSRSSTPAAATSPVRTRLVRARS